MLIIMAAILELQQGLGGRGQRSFMFKRLWKIWSVAYAVFSAEPRFQSNMAAVWIGSII